MARKKHKKGPLQAEIERLRPQFARASDPVWDLEDMENELVRLRYREEQLIAERDELLTINERLRAALKVMRRSALNKLAKR